MDRLGPNIFGLIFSNKNNFLHRFTIGSTNVKLFLPILNQKLSFLFEFIWTITQTNFVLRNNIFWSHFRLKEAFSAKLCFRLTESKIFRTYFRQAERFFIGFILGQTWSKYFLTDFEQQQK